MPYKAKPFEPRFNKYVNKAAGQGPNGDCWEWTGLFNNNSYGVIYRAERKCQGLAHRAAYELANGPIPAKMEILHNCDNPKCVNPAHLSVGSHQDNMRDMANKGRARGGFAWKTHCKRGHEFNEANTYNRPDGGRACRACQKANELKRGKRTI